MRFQKEDKESQVKRHKKRSSGVQLPLRIILIQIIIIAILYLSGVVLSFLVFFTGTTLNGAKVGFSTSSDAEKELNEDFSEIRIIRSEKGKSQPLLTRISMEQIQYVASYDTKSLIQAQPHFDWPKMAMQDLAYEIRQSSFTYDTDTLNALAGQLKTGNLSQDDVFGLLKRAVEEEKNLVFLFESDGFLLRDEHQSDEELISKAREIMAAYDRSISLYLYDDLYETMTDTQLEKVLQIQEDLTLAVDEGAAMEWLDQIAKQYPAVQGHRRCLESGSGKLVYVGWEEDVFDYVFDKEQTEKALAEALLAGSQEPVYVYWMRQERVVKDADPESTIQSEPSIRGLNVNEFGPGTPANGTYIEISIDDQHLWYFENSQLVLESDVVTGYKDIYDTPCGVFWAWNKDEDWNLLMGGSVCDYWVGFWGESYGIHDAYRWRTKYGGDIYTWNGSHGCVNAPLEVVQTLFERVELGIPVIIYETSEGR